MLLGVQIASDFRSPGAGVFAGRVLEPGGFDCALYCLALKRFEDLSRTDRIGITTVKARKPGQIDLSVANATEYDGCVGRNLVMAAAEIEFPTIGLP